TIYVCFFTAASIIVTTCGRNEPVQKPSLPAAIKTPPPQAQPEPNPAKRALPAEPKAPPEGSGIAVWAKEFEGQLVAGRDGALYEPYRPSTIERVQRALIERGLYAGPVNGVLDEPTMKSVEAFQEANANLQRCGVPTPHTRTMLQQGSHTDLSSRSRNPQLS